MASQDLKHQPKQHQDQQLNQQTKEVDTAAADMHPRKPKRSGMASRGLRSLAIGVSLPLSLAVMDIFLFGSSNRYRTIEKPFYFPPLWALHTACLASVLLSGLSAWLIWAEGGFHRQPTALILYLSQLGVSLVWYPIVFGTGATRVGLALCAALFGSLFGCARVFKNLNPFAGDLFKPCLVWALVLAAVNARLVYH